MEQKDDLYYIEKVVNGQVNYFSYIVEKYKDIVFSIALKVLKNRNEAEEMAQEAFIKVYNSLGSFRGKSKFSTWMFSITYNHCISHVRKKKFMTSSIDTMQVKEEAGEINFDEIDEESRQYYLEKALKQLPEDEYTLILLYYYQDQAVEDISRISGLSESNVKVKMHRARKKLYSIMNDLMKEENEVRYE